MTMSQLKTREQVKEEFYRKGITVKGWAEKHGFKQHQVVDVLRKPGPCRYGNSHKIAVLLGIKDGVIDD